MQSPSAPPPLSSFFDGPPLPPAPVSHLPPAVPAAAIVAAPSCLRAPEFLGTHRLALGEVQELDGGRLRVWTGAALHNDPSAEAMRQYSATVPAAALDDRADGLLGAGASGGRQLSGAFLRVQKVTPGDAGTEEAPASLHIWLSPGARPADVLAAAATEGDVHVLWPYRLRVLSAEVLSAVSPDDAALRKAETLEVHLAVDRAAGASADPDGSSPTAVGLLPGDGRARLRPWPTGEPVTVWLSTQGEQQVLFGESSGDAPSAGLSDPDSSGGGGGNSSSLLPPIGSTTLPPLTGASAVSGQRHAKRDSSSAGVPESLDIALHARPLHEQPEAERPFGTTPWVWAVELAGMSLGESERHWTLPLQLAEPAAEAEAEPGEADGGDSQGGVASAKSMAVRFGRHSVRVLRCTGHYVSDVEPGRVASAYPILLLHVQLELCCDRADEGTHDDREGSRGRHAHETDAEAVRREQQELGDLLDRLLG